MPILRVGVSAGFGRLHARQILKPLTYKARLEACFQESIDKCCPLLGG
jgi:hypothetical protein